MSRADNFEQLRKVKIEGMHIQEAGIYMFYIFTC
jgi:hypothetical protein